MESLGEFVAFGVLTLLVMSLVVLYEHFQAARPSWPAPVAWDERTPRQ